MSAIHRCDIVTQQGERCFLISEKNPGEYYLQDEGVHRIRVFIPFRSLNVSMCFVENFKRHCVFFLKFNITVLMRRPNCCFTRPHFFYSVAFRISAWRNSDDDDDVARRKISRDCVSFHSQFLQNGKTRLRPLTISSSPRLRRRTRARNTSPCNSVNRFETRKISLGVPAKCILVKFRSCYRTKRDIRNEALLGSYGSP